MMELAVSWAGYLVTRFLYAYYMPAAPGWIGVICGVVASVAIYCALGALKRKKVCP